ncbi:MAG: Hsp20/alpha crystallin family protein [bacterium]
MRNLFKSNPNHKKDEIELMMEEEASNAFDRDFFDYDQEGQLAVDVYEAKDKFIVKSTIAGADPENLEVSLNKDVLTIRGKREESKELEEENYLYQECYWGKFSRTIILPATIEEDKVEATLEHGILTIVLPKSRKTEEIKIKVKED